MFTTQFFAAYPLRIVPLLGATVAVGLSVPASWVGYFASLASCGTLAGIVLAPYLIRNAGVFGALRACLLASAAGAAAFLAPHLAIVCIGALLLGLADGPAGFAASRELHRAAPPQSRRFLFALTSMGGSFGSLTSALLVALVVSLTDWQTAVVAVTLITAGATLPLQLLARAWSPPSATDAVPTPSARATRGYRDALQLIRHNRPVLRLILGATVLSMSQGAWLTFFVAYLVEYHNVPLQRAAALLAATQTLALISRLGFSKWADAIGSARPAFVAICALATFAWIGLATLDAGDHAFQLYAVIAMAGVSVAAWNGLMGAELAMRVPDSLLVAVNGATAITMTVAYATTVATLAWAAGAARGYVLPFLVVAAALALNAMNFLFLPRSSKRP
jgi:hypothetical protein